MANTSQTTLSKPTLGERWDTIKPVAYALAVGLIAGPILSSMLGFQILSSTARERSQTAAVAVQAQICATQARIAEDRKRTRLNSSTNAQLVCRLLLDKTNNKTT